MKNTFIFLFSFFFIPIINISRHKPITNLFEKFQNYVNEGKIVLNTTHYFIFDELNVISPIPNITKMEILNQKQNEIYSNNGISTYIFIVSQLEGQDNISNISFLLYFDLELSHFAGAKNLIIALYVFDLDELQIGPPSIDLTISKEYVESIKNKLFNNFESGKYYDGLLEYLDDIEYYFGNKDEEKMSKEEIKKFLILFGIVFAIIIAISIGLCMFKRIFCGDFEDNENDNKIINPNYFNFE